MKEVIIPNKTKIEKQAIKQLETKLGIVFPQSYKKFLIKFNGGKALNPRLLFKIKFDDNDTFESSAYFSKLFSLEDIESCYNMNNTDDEGFIEIATANCVVIGTDIGGNAICLGWHGENRNKIYHHSGDFGMVYLSDNLESFLNALVEDTRVF
jgi:hypothetical protein